MVIDVGVPRSTNMPSSDILIISFLRCMLRVAEMGHVRQNSLDNGND